MRTREEKRKLQGGEFIDEKKVLEFQGGDCTNNCMHF